jgi:hypothetical protein
MKAGLQLAKALDASRRPETTHKFCRGGQILDNCLMSTRH